MILRQLAMLPGVCKAAADCTVGHLGRSLALGPGKRFWRGKSGGSARTTKQMGFFDFGTQGDHWTMASTGASTALYGRFPVHDESAPPQWLVTPAPGGCDVVAAEGTAGGVGGAVRRGADVVGAPVADCGRERPAASPLAWAVPVAV